MISTQADQTAVLWVVLCVWGVAFWMAVPGSYTLLAERSRFPTERAGDAQAAMAFGRALGPLVAGALVAGGEYATLGWVGGGLLLVAGALLVAVELVVPPIRAEV